MDNGATPALSGRPLTVTVRIRPKPQEGPHPLEGAGELVSLRHEHRCIFALPTLLRDVERLRAGAAELAEAPKDSLLLPRD